MSRYPLSIRRTCNEGTPAVRKKTVTGKRAGNAAASRRAPKKSKKQAAENKALRKHVNRVRAAHRKADQKASQATKAVSSLAVDVQTAKAHAAACYHGRA